MKNYNFFKLVLLQKKYAHNNKLAKNTTAKVKNQEAFRKPSQAKALKRGFESAWGEKDELHELKSRILIRGAGDDKLVDVKVQQAVPGGSDTKADRLVAPRARLATTKGEGTTKCQCIGYVDEEESDKAIEECWSPFETNDARWRL